ncbi:MAG: efflux RND transporter periplasmic adaptor subunit [Burkholderiales bacterium]|nr:efflux RND transporter periplasmic adaptor subunit [Burkholderiales bacterium]
MDSHVPQRHGKKIAYACAALLAVLLAGYGGLRLLPKGLQVAAGEVRIASVERGMFLDNISVRATAVALNSVLLDSMESGRVEEVIARDGAVVRQGDLLFRLSNTQRHLELLQRQSEYAQQITNLSNLRVSYEASRTDAARRFADLEFNLAQAHKLHDRNSRLQQQAYISAQALEESADKLALQQQLLKDLQASSATELAIKHDAVTQMEGALTRLQSGLRLVTATVDALAVRAPVAGRLTDFRLQVGEIVRPDQHLGRIDDPLHFKLAAQVDEYYLNRVAVGHRAVAQLKEQSYAARLSRIYPQIKDGRFAVELEFEQQPEALSPGRSLDVNITLGEPAPALLLPNGAYLNDSGGAWVLVQGPDADTYQRRNIRLGRRSNQQAEVLSGLALGEKVIVSGYAQYGKAERVQLRR